MLKRTLGKGLQRRPPSPEQLGSNTTFAAMDRMALLATRKAVLDWRDAWQKRIFQRLNKEMGSVRHELNERIDKMNVSNVALTDRFIEKTLNPMLARWMSEQSTQLIRQAQAELLIICKHTITLGAVKSDLKGSPLNEKLLDIAGATVSAGATAVAVPIAIGASTTTASVGGVLGFLGVTTTVVSAPAVIVGAAAVAAAGLLARSRIKKVKSNTQQRLREDLAIQTQQKVLFNRDGTALNQLLQRVIEDTAEKMLKELMRAR